MRRFPKATFSAFFLALFLWISPAQAEPEAPPQNAFVQALQLKQQGELERAEEAFKKIIEESPSNAEAHFELSNIYAAYYDELLRARRGEQADLMLERAGRELEQAAMFRADFMAAQFNLGVVYKKQGRYEKAREIFKKILEKDPRQIAALMQIGAIYEEQGFFDEAEASYRQAQEIDPLNPEVQTSVRELSRRRSAYEEEHRQSDMSQLNSMMQNPNLSAYQNARYGAEGGLQNQNPQNGGMQQALPYLGSMLVQQFMKSRSKE